MGQITVPAAASNLKLAFGNVDTDGSIIVASAQRNISAVARIDFGFYQIDAAYPFSTNASIAIVTLRGGTVNNAIAEVQSGGSAHNRVFVFTSLLGVATDISFYFAMFGD